jgi:hypothetical protein
MFKEGDQVWLEGCNLHLDQPSAKLAPKRHGPFTIKRVLSPITYQLTLPHQWKIHDVFHVDLLTPYVMIHATMIRTLISFLYLLHSHTPHPVTHYDVP